MALTDEGGTGMVMPVAPIGYGNGYGGGNGFGFGGDLSGLIVLFLFAAMFGFGGNGFGGFGGFGGDGMFPWLLSGQAGINANTNNGFDNAAVGSQLSGIHNAVTNGFATAEVAGCNRAMDAMQTAYGNQIADLNRSFDAQSAIGGKIDSLSMALQKCCCDNQLQTESLRATVLQENCADRYEAQSNARDIIENQTAGFQKILDKMCDQELSAERRANDQLRQELNMANLAASQTAQTARLLADNALQTQQIENYVRPQINPAYIVPNPYAYNFYPNNGWGSSCGCGCGNNGNF